MGGIDKPLVQVGGRSLLQGAVDAVHHCSPIVVVGPESPVEGVGPVWVRENPPFSGPAAAIVSAVDLVTESDWTFVLACDLPFAADVSRGVARPAAPFSAFVAGLVAGRRGGSPEDVRATVAEISRMAAGWTPAS
jgi:hypothetical protein